MSTGFSFGAKTTAVPTFGTGSITFGTPAAQTAPKFGFGAPATGTQFGAPTTGFGAPAASAPSTGFTLGGATSGFGAAPAASAAPSFGFGTTPAAAAPAGGLSFGAAATSTAAPAGGLSFGAAAPAASTGLSFGAPAASTGLSFGAPAASTPGLSFGTTPAATSTGLSFGTTPAATSTGLSFGTTPAATSTGLSFGTAAPLSFGATTSAPTGLTFGAPASTQAGLSFGATTSAPISGLSFGTATTSAPSLGLSFPAASSAATPSLGLSFGTNTSAPTLSFGGASTSTAPSFGLGGISTVSTGLNLSTTTSQPQNVGLGGIAQTQSKTGTAASTQKEVPPKEQFLPNEFLQLVDNFKQVVQEEKKRSSDVARCSIKEFCKVESELDVLTQQFNQVENNLQTNRNLAEQLKFDTAKGLQNIEMAQRTQDTPPSLQYDNTAPLQFFIELADNFEREMQVLKLKIDNTEKFVKKCHEPSVLTSQDLALGMRRLHDTFVALAGRMQSIHSQVEAQKEHFLKLRKQTMKDSANPFEMNKNIEAMNTIMRNAVKSSPPKLASGPTPFNSFALGSNNLTLAAQQATPPAYPATTTSSLGFGNTSFGAQGFNTSLNKPGTGFGLTPLFGTSSSTNLQLQKPPTGNKRAPT